jgi:hypothetical protein
MVSRNGSTTKQSFGSGLSDATFACIAFAVTFAVSVEGLRNVEVEWLFDLDDKDNFITHPIFTHLETETNIANISQLARLAFQPVLGVLEPVSLLIRVLVGNIFGRTALTFYLFGSVLHSLNAVQLFFVIGTLINKISINHSTISNESSIAGTLWWSLHPLRGESLGWLSCQSYLLATFFVLVSLRLSMNSLPETSFARMCGSLIAFIMACGCKAAVVTLPLFFVLVHVLNDLSNRRSLVLSTARAMARHWAFFVVAGATVVGTMAANAPTSETASGVSAESVPPERNAKPCYFRVRPLTSAFCAQGLFWSPATLSRPQQMAKALLAAFIWYPAKVAHPFGLRVLYLTPRSFAAALSACEPIASAVVGLSAGATVWAHRKGRRPWPSRPWPSGLWPSGLWPSGLLPWAAGAAGAWLVLLLPTLGFASHGWTLLGADRYTYLPTALVAAPLAAATHQRLCQRLEGRASSRAAVAALLLAQALGLAGGLVKWRSSDALWPRAAVCRTSFGAVEADFNGTYNGSFNGTFGPERAGSEGGGAAAASGLHLYACPDVIALYNLGRRLQRVRLRNRSFD